MTKGTYKIRFLIAFISVLVVVYLLWVGSQYVVEKEVVLGYVDHVVAIVLAWYITRDVMVVDSKLRWAEQPQYQQAYQRKK